MKQLCTDVINMVSSTKRFGDVLDGDNNESPIETIHAAIGRSRKSESEEEESEDDAMPKLKKLRVKTHLVDKFYTPPKANIGTYL